MDEYVYMACAVVAVLVLVVVMYMGSVYVMREKSFESALVEQSSGRRELLDRTPNKHEKKPRRQHVRGKHQEKTADDGDKAAALTDTPVHHHSPSAKKRVELELEPMVIDLKETEDKGIPFKKVDSPSKPAKSILLNKEEKGEVCKTMNVPELFHRHTSVDELDLKIERRRSDTTLVAVVEKEVSITSHTETPPKGKKKKLKSSGSQESSEVESHAVLTETSEIEKEIAPTTACGLLKSAGVTNCDQVLEAEGRLDDKQTRELQASVNTLKKRLTENEKDLAKEKSQVASCNAQIKRLQEELMAERRKLEENLAQKSHFEAEAQKVATNQLKQANEKHSRDISTLQSRIDLVQSQLVEAGRTKQQLIDENRHLKDATQRQTEMAQKMAVLEDALKKSSVTLASTENAKQHLELKLHQYEEQINQLGSRLTEANSQNVDLMNEIQQFTQLKEQLNSRHSSELQHLENRLKESEVQKSKLESQTSALQCRLMELERKLIKSAPVEYQLQVHNGVPDVCSVCQTGLTAENACNISDARLRSEQVPKSEEYIQLQQLLNEQKQKNDDLRQKNYLVLNALSEMEKKAQEAVSLKDECEKKVAELNRLRAELKELKNKQQQSKHNDDKEKVGMATPKKTKANTEKSKSVQENELSAVLVNGISTDASLLSDEVARLQDLLAAQKAKNEELRQKNYTVLEALSKLEKMAESSVRLKDQLALRDKEVEHLTAELANHELKQKQQSERGTSPRATTVSFNEELKQLHKELEKKDACLRQLQADLDAVKSSSSVMQEERRKLEDAIKKLHLQIAQKDSVIKKLTQSEETVKEKPSAVTDEQTELQVLVQHYKTILHDTETMLSSLQASVEKEETAWRLKLATLEEELRKERRRSKGLEEQIAGLRLV